MKNLLLNKCHTCLQADVECTDPTCKHYIGSNFQFTQQNTPVCLVCHKQPDVFTCTNKDCPHVNNTNK